MRGKRARWAALQLAIVGLVVGAFAFAPGSGAVTLPSGFQESVVFSGLVNPTAVEFASDGRVFVAEKRGVIKVFDSLTDTTPTTFADLNKNVYNFWDRGLLGLALDPNFPASPYVYVLYTYDANIGGTAPKYGTDGVYSDPCPNPPGATSDGCVVSGRLSRLTAAGNQMTGSEQVLVEDWCQQFPSHSIGALGFGADGALYVSGGDGASFNVVDYGQAKSASPPPGYPNPCGDPPGAPGSTLVLPTAEGGALRSQDLVMAADPTSLDGAILRVDPTTGAGLPTNPLAGSSDANARRIVAYGLRNPFRFTIRPGTSEVWLGDVGWNDWEEIDRIADPLGSVENFGWPCWEGVGRQAGYDNANINICEHLYSSPADAPVTPYYTYGHHEKVVAGEACPPANPPTPTSSSITGIAFYEGGEYPSSYDDALFFADYSRNCIWVMFRGTNGLPNPANRATFAAAAASPVELEIGPAGDLFYVDFLGNTIRRIRYFSANQPPVAVATASPTNGAAPLTVSFDGSGSSDPEGAQLSYAWDLDGDTAFDDSAMVAPSYTYQQPGTYNARLRVTDPQGGSSTSAAITITVANTPPSGTILTPAPTLTWRVGQAISFSGSATDPQQGTLPASAFFWRLVLHHCPSDCHQHLVQEWAGVTSASFSAPDHEYPSWLELTLIVTDAGGLTDTETLRLDPRTVALAFQSSPAGLQLTVGSSNGTAPFSRTVIEGSANSVSAPSPQSLGGSSYQFVSWSDGGAQTHIVVANAAGTYTATYAAAQSADLALAKTGAKNGNDATWTVTATNLGPQTAQNVVITDTLPSRLTFGTAPGCTYNQSTRVVTCLVGSLTSGGPGATFTITTTITGSGGGWITNVAQVSGSTADSNAANNTASARVRGK